MAGRVVKAVFGVAGILLVSRLLGFFREVIIADIFGTSAQYDLYLVAIMLPALLSGVLSFASIYLFVPYLSAKAKHSTDGEITIDWPSIRPAINLAKTSALIMALAIIFLAPYIMKIWGSNYSGEDFGLIVFYCRLTAFMVVLGVTEAFMRAFLNVKRIFTYPASGYIVYNVTCILAIVFLNKQLSVGAIAVGMMGGLIIQNIYLLVRIMGYHPFKGLHLKLIDDDSRAILATGGIIILIEFINRSYFLIDRYVAPQFGEGVISALNYGQVLIQLPDSIIGLAIGAVVFPMFSQASNDAQDNKFGDVYRKAITSAILIAIPIAAFYLINAEDLVHLLFQRGQFDQASVTLTAAILKPYAPSIIALFVISTSIRACYSGGWGKYVLVFAAVIFATKFVGTFVLAKIFGYAGITAATSLAHIGFASFMLIFLTKKVPATVNVRFVWNIVMLLLIGLVTVLSAYYLKTYISGYLDSSDITGVIIKLLVLGVFVLVVYLLGVYFMGLKSVLAISLQRSPRTTDE